MIQFLPKLPDEYSYGLLFSYASGKSLDVYGKIYGIPRRRFEPGVIYKRRLAKTYVRRLNIGGDTE